MGPCRLFRPNESGKIVLPIPLPSQPRASTSRLADCQDTVSGTNDDATLGSVLQTDERPFRNTSRESVDSAHPRSRSLSAGPSTAYSLQSEQAKSPPTNRATHTDTRPTRKDRPIQYQYRYHFHSNVFRRNSSPSDDSYYYEHVSSGNKQKGRRVSPEQLAILNSAYAENNFPNTSERLRLSEQLKMTPRSVQIWFQNKRRTARILS
ncbi:hypothetical protein PLICRDRAFT_34275 [Plicaturopsis crispa FD-325 SS-3]|nr:hypothetical protein PLICRDRAFT_34275 [Plicaturopsis crispa FD-325 SS-3]